uniref:HEAT repeat domain-containing protein n=1 Tax=Zooxanthella nutricula TaxID=1333877 RepID=A0A7S2J7W7_9DINO
MGEEGAAHEADLLGRMAVERDPRVMAAAGVSLAAMGKATGSVSSASLDAIGRMFLSQHPGVRAAAAEAVYVAGGESAAPLMGKLLKCLDDRSPKVKIAAASALAQLGEFGEVYAVNLCRLAHDPSQLPAVRAVALDALAYMEERGAALCDDIAELLQDPEVEVSQAAQRALEAFGIQVGWF